MEADLQIVGASLTARNNSKQREFVLKEKFKRSRDGTIR